MDFSHPKGLPVPEIVYRARAKRRKLDVPIWRASSMAEELAPLVLWIKHLLSPGEMLVIEEPEAHLHPESQRRVARALVRLARAGVTVLCITHSPLIVHQVSNHILASQADPARLEEVGFTEEDLLREEEVGAYLFRMREDGRGSEIRPLRIELGFGVPEDEFVEAAEEIGEEAYRLTGPLTIGPGEEQGPDPPLGSQRARRKGPIRPRRARSSARLLGLSGFRQAQGPVDLARGALASAPRDAGHNLPLHLLVVQAVPLVARQLDVASHAVRQVAGQLGGAAAAISPLEAIRAVPEILAIEKDLHGAAPLPVGLAEQEHARAAAFVPLKEKEIPRGDGRDVRRDVAPPFFFDGVPVDLVLSRAHGDPPSARARWALPDRGPPDSGPAAAPDPPGPPPSAPRRAFPPQGS